MMQKTRFPGVFRLPDGRYLLDATGRCPKTGRRKRKRLIVEAHNAAAANARREELRKAIERVAAALVQVRLGDAAISWLRSKAPALKSVRGTLAKYINCVRSASEGCVTDEF